MYWIFGGSSAKTGILDSASEGSLEEGSQDAADAVAGAAVAELLNASAACRVADDPEDSPRTAIFQRLVGCAAMARLVERRG